jgi:hypothetical protein
LAWKNAIWQPCSWSSTLHNCNLFVAWVGFMILNFGRNWQGKRNFVSSKFGWLFQQKFNCIHLFRRTQFLDLFSLMYGHKNVKIHI